MKIVKKGDYIQVEYSDGSCADTQSVDTHLLYEILQKLEKICCGLIDIETAVQEHRTTNPFAD